jgi:hypothetical protein
MAWRIRGSLSLPVLVGDKPAEGHKRDEEDRVWVAFNDYETYDITHTCGDCELELPVHAPAMKPLKWGVLMP